MIITIIILSYFIVTLISSLIYVCHEAKFSKDEIFALSLFTLCPPLYLLIGLCIGKIRRQREKKRIEEARRKKNESNTD